MKIAYKRKRKMEAKSPQRKEQKELEIFAFNSQ